MELRTYIVCLVVTTATRNQIGAVQSTQVNERFCTVLASSEEEARVLAVGDSMELPLSFLDTFQPTALNRVRRFMPTTPVVDINVRYVGVSRTDTH